VKGARRSVRVDPVETGSPFPLDRRGRMALADKSPKKPSSKKPGMSLKEKRVAKKLKHSGSSSMDALRTPKTGH
jgi:hypothetical protein